MGLQLLEVSHKLMVGYCSPHGWSLPFILYHFRHPLWLWNFEAVNLITVFSFSLKLGMEKTFLHAMVDGTSTIRSASVSLQSISVVSSLLVALK